MDHPSKAMEALAFHEAGHALQVVLEGGKAHQATIVSVGHSSECVHHTVWRSDRGGVLSKAAAEKYGRVALAGPAATRHHNGPSVHRERMKADRLAASAFAEAITVSERERNAIVRLWNVQAEDSLAKYWPLVCALAQALLDRKTLTGHEVRDVVDDVAKRLEFTRLLERAGHDSADPKSSSLTG